MKRSIAFVLSWILILLPSLTLLSGCGGEKDAYKITFSVNGEKTVVKVPAGEIPEYPGETSWETSEHFYKITGWDKEFSPATKNVTYTATVGEYGLTLYEVLFNLPTGLVTVQTHEGEIPTPPKGYEIDDTKADWIGTFKEWSPELEAPTPENTKNGTEKMTYKPIYTLSPRYTATLLQAKDGAKGVLTMTYDDGLYETAVWVNEQNKRYGVKGSCMMVPDWGQGNPDFTYNGGSVEKWTALFAEGTLEPESHSMSHEGIGILANENNATHWQNYMYNNYQENYDYQLVQAKEAIQAAFPGSPVLCFAPSNNTLSTVSWASDGNGNLVKNANNEFYLVQDGGALKVAQETYYAIRQGFRGVQPLNPTPNAEQGGWYNLAMRGFKDHSGNDKLVQGKKWIDDAVKNSTWLIIMCHGIRADGGDIKQSLAEQFFAYAGEYIRSGELWAATFGEATKYIRERQNTTVSERYDESNKTVYVDMKINRKTEDGKVLTESIFNYPLTVEVRVPSNWKKVSYVGQGGKMQTAAVYSRNGCYYAMVNLIPGADGATVTTAIRPLS